MCVCIKTHQKQPSCGPQRQLSRKLRNKVKSQVSIWVSFYTAGFVFIVFNKAVGDCRMLTLATDAESGRRAAESILDWSQTIITL